MDVSDIIRFTRLGFSVFQRRIILAILYQLKAKHPNRVVFQFKAREIMEGIEPKMSYGQLQREMQQLTSRLYEIDAPDQLLQVSLLSSTTFLKGKGIISIEVSRAIHPFLLNLIKKYPLGCLYHLFGFNSIHAIRLYLLLYKHGEERLMYNISDFKRLMSVEHQYRDYHTFKRRVILQAQKELHLTDMAFHYEERKISRKVEQIVFIKPPISTLYLPKEKQRLAKKLMKELQLSLPQAQRITLQFTKEEIAANVYAIKEKQRAGAIKSSLAAYTVGFFENSISIAF